MTGVLTLDVEDWEHANFRQLEGREGELALTDTDTDSPILPAANLRELRKRPVNPS